jgi:hypothetical protein
MLARVRFFIHTALQRGVWRDAPNSENRLNGFQVKPLKRLKVFFAQTCTPR